MRVPKKGETFAEIAVRESTIVDLVSIDHLNGTAIVQDEKGRKVIIRAKRTGNSTYTAVAEV